MTPDERRFLFDGVSTATRAAFTLNGNADRFEALWDTRDPDEFFVRLRDFAKHLGLSAYSFYPEQCPELTDRIAADVKLVCDRCGWWWAHDRSPPKGSC
jgi:hypothetical protein